MMKQWDDGSCTTVMEIEKSPGGFRETLQATLIDEQKCEAFIDWMYLEFSSEAILSFLEFVQFRQFVKEQIGRTDKTGNAVDSGPFDFALYDGIPQSTIIYDTFRLDQGTLQFSVVEVSLPSASGELRIQASPFLVACDQVSIPKMFKCQSRA